MTLERIARHQCQVHSLMALSNPFGFFQLTSFFLDLVTSFCSIIDLEHAKRMIPFVYYEDFFTILNSRI